MLGSIGTRLVLRSSGVVLEPGFPKAGLGLEFEGLGLGPGALLALPLWPFLLISPWPLSLGQGMGSSAQRGTALTGSGRPLPLVILAPLQCF